MDFGTGAVHTSHSPAMRRISVESTYPGVRVLGSRPHLIDGQSAHDGAAPSARSDLTSGGKGTRRMYDKKYLARANELQNRTTI